MAATNSKPSPILITKAKQLSEACMQCRDSGIIGFDTEFVMEDRYMPEVCLIQIAIADAVFIVDPLADLDVTEVWEIVADKDITTVVHAGYEDMALCAQHLGQPPAAVFDTQIAAGLCDLDYPLSLLRLVHSVLGVKLNKSKTLTDWRRRPLAEAQIHYGAEDVNHLLGVHAKLHAYLKKNKRLSWAEEEFSKFVDMNTYQKNDEQKFSKIKGGGSLRGHSLVVLHDLSAWRDAFAKRVNRPARTVLRDHLLVEIAKHQLSNPTEISELRGNNLSRRDVKDVAEIVAIALQKTPPKQQNRPHRELETPKEAAIVALTQAAIRSYCLEHGLAYGLVATQKTIRQLVQLRNGDATQESSKPELLDGWRGQTVGCVVGDLLAGHGHLSVKSIRDELTVKITQK